jgi:hypothetical protein
MVERICDAGASTAFELCSVLVHFWTGSVGDMAGGAGRGKARGRQHGRVGG